MDYNEAIEILIEKQHEIEEYGATDLAIEALEKQIPKEVNSKCDEDWEYYYCGNCNVNVDEDNNYCVDCGQKVNWD